MIAQSVAALPQGQEGLSVSGPAAYLAYMLQRTFPAGFIAPCLPTKIDKLPFGVRLPALAADLVQATS